MATDKLLWGSARPRFRIGTTAIQTNGTNYVLNQPVSDHRIVFPKEGILSQAIKGKLFEKKRGNRGIFSFIWDLLDRPSAEALITILNTSDDLYVRPHFNYYKEYLCRNVQGWEMERFGKVNQPYAGGLSMETISLETTIPTESPGSFNFDGSTKVEKAVSITGDISIELWIKTPAVIDSAEKLLICSSAGVAWTVYILSDKTIQFRTDDGAAHNLTSTNEVTEDTWYYIVFRRYNTDWKSIYVDGVEWAKAQDSKAANNITAFRLGETASGFTGLCQIARLNNKYLSPTYSHNRAIEAILSGDVSDIEIWWDFSQGNADDLTANENDGTVTGTEAYYEESFPDKHYEILT